MAIMKPSFGVVKDLRQAYSLPPFGNFALEVEPPKTPHWDHCREQFASKFNETTHGFYYSVRSDEWVVGGGQHEDVAAFLVKCEVIIGTGLESPLPISTFNKTTKSTVLWIAPSLFWLGCEMKRSILTAFLRCGLNYDRTKDNFDDALFSDEFVDNKWVRETKAATMRFLFGFTRWTESKDRSEYAINKHGWHEEFKSSDIVHVRRKLALPEGKLKENSIIGLESLWA